MSRHVGLLLCPRVLAPIASAEARWCHPHHQYKYFSCTYLVRLALARNFESVWRQKVYFSRSYILLALKELKY